ncbi:uncharacterized protein LOC143643778 [Tamandua tetradactyla]|uniref:uncharacterized protein LOC143643778 n=1 Tax=Tamandua tetradactyla TaxID=48850 RepID=UPI0040538847
MSKGTKDREAASVRGLCSGVWASFTHQPWLPPAAMPMAHPEIGASATEQSPASIAHPQDLLTSGAAGGEQEALLSLGLWTFVCTCSAWSCCGHFATKSIPERDTDLSPSMSLREVE